LFLAAFERSANVQRKEIRSAAKEGATGRERIFHVLTSYVRQSLGSKGRRGCIVVGSAVELSALDPVARALVGMELEASEKFIADLIREGQADGSIPDRVDAHDTAGMMICIAQGLRVLGKVRLPLDVDRITHVVMKLLD